jgi:hypothetical protein
MCCWSIYLAPSPLAWTALQQLNNPGSGLLIPKANVPQNHCPVSSNLLQDIRELSAPAGGAGLEEQSLAIRGCGLLGAQMSRHHPNERQISNYYETFVVLIRARSGLQFRCV